MTIKIIKKGTPPEQVSSVTVKMERSETTFQIVQRLVNETLIEIRERRELELRRFYAVRA